MTITTDDMEKLAVGLFIPKDPFLEDFEKLIISTIPKIFERFYRESWDNTLQLIHRLETFDYTVVASVSRVSDVENVVRFQITIHRGDTTIFVLRDQTEAGDAVLIDYLPSVEALTFKDLACMVSIADQFYKTLH